MLGSLPPLDPEWAPHEEVFHDIARVVTFATGFVLVPVAVPGPDLARALARWLVEAGHPVAVHELIDDAAWERLAVFLMSQSPPPDGVVMVIGPGTPRRGVSEPLALVNQARDAIVKKLRRPLLWCGPRWFLKTTWEDAPDFWSIRSVDHSMYPALDAPPIAPAPVVTAPAAASPAAQSPVAAPAPPPMGLERASHAEALDFAPQDELASEAIAQGDAVSAAILAARDAESALSGGRAGDALRIVDQQLAAGRAVPIEMRQRLAVLRARALAMLGRTGEAITELDALLATEGLSPAVELDALLERGRLALMAEDASGAEERFWRALSLAEQVGSAEDGIRARIGLGEAAMWRGNTGDSRRLLNDAAVGAEKLHDEDLLRAARDALARVYEQSRDTSTARRMSAELQLDPDLLERIREAAISAGLAYERGALLAGLSPSLVASLPYAPTPGEQLRSDLSAMNRAPRLRDGERPLVIWLKNAAALAAHRAGAAVLHEALAALGASPPAPSEAPALAARPPGPSSGPAGSASEAAPAPLCILLYSHRDERHAQALRKHMTPLLRAGVVRWWSPDQILPGEDWRAAIEQHVRQADLVAVLVGPDVLADDETMRWIELALHLGKRVVPILLRHCMWEISPLGAIPPLPQNGKPILASRNKDKAWVDVVSGLRDLLPATGS